MKQVLIFSTLKSQVNYNDNINITQTEPIHPYVGVLWSNLIKEYNKGCNDKNNSDKFNDICQNI